VFDFNRTVCRVTLTWFFADVRVRESDDVEGPDALAVCPKPSESLALQWLALALIPRLGPTRTRRLIEHFGGVQNIFKASLTELEATGRGARTR
jgi:hypothetical protein